MSCTEGYMGFGRFNKQEKYPLYNGEYYYETIRNIYYQKGRPELFYDGYPYIWNSLFLETHNCAIASSVVINKECLESIGLMNEMKQYHQADDYDCWLNIIKLTDCVYINEPLVYFDGNHGK